MEARQVTIHTILLGAGGSICTSNTLHHLKDLSLDSLRAFCHKVITSRCTHKRTNRY